MLEERFIKDIKLYYILYIIGISSIALYIISYITMFIADIMYESVSVSNYYSNPLIGPILFVIICKFYIVGESKYFKKIEVASGIECKENYKVFSRFNNVANANGFKLPKTLAMILTSIYSVFVVLVLCGMLIGASALDDTEIETWDDSYAYSIEYCSDYKI